MDYTFSTADYIIFAATLAISSAIGLIFAWKGRRKAQNSEYLLGSKQMPILPSAISLFASYTSGVAILGYPAEIYTYGTAYVWSLPGALFAMVASAAIILPVLHRINAANIYIYLEHRFNSPSLRLFASMVFVIQNMIYMAVVLYAPSTALSSITHLPLWILILAVGGLCTVYASLGGLKAIVWTDCFQAIIMYGGSILLLVKGVVAAGGVRTVWDIAQKRGRLAGFTYINADPFQYMTLWTGLFGGFFYWFAAYGSYQTALQRYCSMPTIRSARIALALNIPAMLLMSLTAFATGLTMYAYYADCDPLTDPSQTLSSKDQLVVHFVLDVLGSITCLPGIYLACLFSGTLSVVSGGINSLSAVTFENMKPLWHRFDDEKVANRTTKLLGFVFGVVAIGVAFAAQYLGGIVEAVLSGLGCFSGPLLGVFLLGILFPFANRCGALFGLGCGSCFSLWIFVGQQIYKPDAGYALPTTNACCGIAESCSSNLTVDFYSVHPNPEPSGVLKLYALSYNMFTLVGCMSVLFIGCTISLATMHIKRFQGNSSWTYWNIKDLDSKGRDIRPAYDVFYLKETQKWL